MVSLRQRAQRREELSYVAGMEYLSDEVEVLSFIGRDIRRDR
jgi:hypothetical protein